MFNIIKDTSVRRSIEAIIRRFEKLDSISQLPKNATTAQIIDAINRITAKDKRR